MQNDNQPTQTQSRAAREPSSLNNRLSFSPAEFAALNGKSATWGYRRIYHGDIKVIADTGRLLIPRSEVDRFLARAAEYNPKPKPGLQEHDEARHSRSEPRTITGPVTPTYNE